MDKECAVVYTSISGNTKRMALAISEGLEHAGCKPEIQEMYNAKAASLQKYHYLLFGSSTWGDGELPDEAMDFFEDLDQLDLNGKTVAVFGSGDSSYEIFCAAVDLLKDKLTDLGAKIVLEPLKMELVPTASELEICREYGRSFWAVCSQK